jgi:methylated-DNA-[protein]-cysteine S-methyltransferase
MINSLTMESPIGPLRLEANGDALCGMYFPNTTLLDAHPRGRGGVLAEAQRQLKAYFAGKLVAFDLLLAAEGTEFQRGVWTQLSRIPYGETCCYGDIAKRIGTPTASRAVGAANGKNPIAIIVPCHRVIGSTGSLTGFGGGLPAKQWLLAHEARVAGRQVTLPV